MKDIEAIINEKRSEVARLRRAVEDLKGAESDLQVLEEAYRIMGGEIKVSVDDSKHLQFSSDAIPHPPTNAEAAEEILKDYGKPLHIKAIHNEIKSRYGKDTTLDSVNVTIVRKIKKGETFYKTDPATYGLSAWYQSKNDNGVTVDS
jgi:HB1, ASXL, restriction endonuclease HTH domain